MSIKALNICLAGLNSTFSLIHYFSKIFYSPRLMSTCEGIFILSIFIYLTIFKRIGIIIVLPLAAQSFHSDVVRIHFMFSILAIRMVFVMSSSLVLRFSLKVLLNISHSICQVCGIAPLSRGRHLVKVGAIVFTLYLVLFVGQKNCKNIFSRKLNFLLL